MHSERSIMINRTNIVNQVAAFLYAIGEVPDSEDITNIQFSDLFGASTEEFCKAKIFTTKEVHN